MPCCHFVPVHWMCFFMVHCYKTRIVCGACGSLKEPMVCSYPICFVLHWLVRYTGCIGMALIVQHVYIRKFHIFVHSCGLLVMSLLSCHQKIDPFCTKHCEEVNNWYFVSTWYPFVPQHRDACSRNLLMKDWCAQYLVC